MLASIAPYLRCPTCASTPLHGTGHGMSCEDCGAQYPLVDGVLDLTGGECREIITPFQRIMQTPAVAAIYEKVWRRVGYFLASSRSFESELETVLSMNQDKDTSRVLDLACGTGVFTRPLAAQSSGIVVGLDLSWAMLRQARRALERTEIKNVVLVRGNAFRIPFVEDAFTYVNCCGALHLFDRPEDVLREIGRVLEKGGHLAVQTTIRPSRSAGFAYLLEHFIRFGFFDQADLDEIIRRHHFDTVYSERHRISYTFLGRYIY